jgi:hypothetical protein
LNSPSALAEPWPPFLSGRYKQAPGNLGETSPRLRQRGNPTRELDRPMAIAPDPNGLAKHRKTGFVRPSSSYSIVRLLACRPCLDRYVPPSYCSTDNLQELFLEISGLSDLVSCVSRAVRSRRNDGAALRLLPLSQPVTSKQQNTAASQRWLDGRSN